MKHQPNAKRFRRQMRARELAEQARAEGACRSASDWKSRPAGSKHWPRWGGKTNESQ